MVSLYFGHVSLHSSALPIPVNQTPKLTEILCLQMLCLPCAFLSYYGVFSYPCIFRIMQAKWALTELLQLQVGVEGNFVWFVLLLPRRRPPHLSCSIDRSIHQLWLLAVFRRLTSPSLPPAPTATASPSSTQQMNLRSTRVHKRGRTLLILLM